MSEIKTEDGFYLVLVLDLAEHLLKALLHIRKKIQKTGSNEDSASEAGGEGDHQSPPLSRRSKQQGLRSFSLSFLKKRQ